MAGHAKLRKLADLATHKQILQMRADHAGERHKQPLATCYFGRHGNHARQHARHFHNGNVVLTPERVAPAQTHDEIQRLVGYFRKRMRRVQPHGNQQRAHLPLKILFHPMPLRQIPITMRDDFDALLLKRGHQFVVVQGVLAVHQAVGGSGQLLKRFDREHTLRLKRLAGGQMRLGPHLEKLIQI